MSQKKESFFWTSYADLMTSLFFVMLSLFVLFFLLLQEKNRITEEQNKATKAELEKIKAVQQSTKDLNREYFTYNADFEKYILKTTVPVEFEKYKHDIHKIIPESSRAEVLEELRKAGKEIRDFLRKHKDNQYLLIIEGQASREATTPDKLANYELSYRRAYSLVEYWSEDCLIRFDSNNCEILIAGSGGGRLAQWLKTKEMREPDPASPANRRFLIHIIPKNIIE